MTVLLKKKSSLGLPDGQTAQQVISNCTNTEALFNCYGEVVPPLDLMIS